MSRLTQVRRARSRSQSGVALLMVLVLVTLLGAVVTEFTFNSRVDLQLAVNARDELQAEYNALSALRLRAVILRQSQKIKLIVTQLMGGDSGSFPLGQILEMIPVECGLMSAIIQTSESGDSGGDGEGGGGDFFQGDCIATSQSEHSKISLNVLDSNSKQDAMQIAEYLYALLLDPKLERHFQEDDKNGTHAESPEQLVGAVADWIDRDENEFGTQVGDEGRHYAYLKDSYEAKNAPLDSVAEIQLIHGIDDEIAMRSVQNEAWQKDVERERERERDDFEIIRLGTGGSRDR